MMEVGSDKIASGDLKRCGDITTLLSVGKKEFFLNCGFCNYTFCQLDNFIQHICEEHMYQFTVPKVEDEVELSLDLEEEMEDVDSEMQEEYAAEEYDENNTNLRNFERVEIELDESIMSESMDAKEATLDDFASDLNEESINNYDSDSEFLERTHDSNGDADFAANLKLLGLGDFDKKILLDIFGSYERRQVLWDAELQGPKYSKRREREIKEIAAEVGIPDQYDTIRKLIGKLSSRLRTEMIRKKIYESKGREYSPTWYTDLNSFIKLRKPVAPVKPQPVKKISIPESLLNDEQCVILAETYKEFTTLWDVKDITYRFSNRRREASQMFFEKYNEITGLNLTKYDFECEILRIRRICSYEKKRKLYCKRQDLTYKPSFKYFEHIQFLEADVSPYECLTCGKLIGGSQQYKVHVASHDGSLPFKCDVCGHAFRLLSNLTVHLRRHAQDFMYNCEVCNKACATATELKIHMRYHTGEKPYVCEICGNKYRSVSDLKMHTNRHEKLKQFECEVCSKSFYMKSLLREHMSVHTKERNKMCNICGKTFTTSKHLRQHKQIHDAEKKYVCKICGKRFAQYAGLSCHVKSHGTTLAEVSSKTVDFTTNYNE